MADPQDAESSNYQLKSLGVYSNLYDLRELFGQLTSVINEKGLINNKSIYVRLAEEPQPKRLTTEVLDIDQVEEERWERSLFFIDVVSLLTGVAKLLNQSGKTKALGEFKLDTPDNFLLRQWFQEQRSGKLTQESFAKLLDFIERVNEAFSEINPEKPESADNEEEKPTTGSGSSRSVSLTANVDAKVNSQQPGADTEGANSDTYSQPIIDLNDTSVRIKLNNEINWIYAFARRELLIKHLESLDTNFESLPKELQQQFLQLSMELRNEIVNLIESLPEEQIAKLLADVGNLRNRAEIFNLLIQRILSDPRSQFLTKLGEFYKKYFYHIAETRQDINLEEAIEQFQLLKIKDDTTNEVLKRISESIKEWKQELIEKFEEERRLREEAKNEEDVPEDTTLPTPQEASINSKLPPAALNAINQTLDKTGFSTNSKAILRDEAPRLVWGTAAELFADDNGSMLAVDPELFKQLNDRALDYILSLDASELEKLHKSPSTLIRHIKNLRDRMLRDETFMFSYQKYKSTHDVPILSRAERVERETEWAEAQFKFELFGAHNLTDTTVPDEDGSQKVFDELKHYLGEKIFVYFDQLSEDALEQLYIRPDQRPITIRQLRVYLNDDRVFTETLSRFYNKVLDYYGTSGKEVFQNRLRGSLEKTIATDGVHYQLNEQREGTDKQLFSAEILKTINSDSQVLLNAVSVTLDSMIIAHGLESTQKLINNIDTNQLELSFGLEKGTLKGDSLLAFRSLLVEFAEVRSGQFTAISGYDKFTGLYGGATKAKEAQQTPRASYSTMIAQSSQVREMSQDAGAEEVVEATSKKSMKEKAQIFFKVYEQSWNQISQEGQIAIYLYYGKAVDQGFIKGTVNAGQSLPLPLEFMDFEDKLRKNKELLNTLIKEYQTHGAKEFNPLLTEEFATDATSVVEHYKRVEKLKASLTLYYLESMDAIEQQQIAEAQGYETLEKLITELQVQADVEAFNQANWEFAMAVPAVAEIMADQSYDVPTGSGKQQGNLFRTIYNARNKSGGQGGKPSAAQRLTDAIKKVTKKKAKKAVGEQVVKKTVGAVAKKWIGGVAAGATLGLSYLLTNDKTRDFTVGALTYLTAQTLYALSTIGGLLGGLIGGIGLGIFGGIPGGLLGTMIGANVGAQLAPWQWGDWLGFSPRQPPGPWFGSGSGLDSTTASMEGARAANAAAAAQATTAANTAATNATAAQTAATSQAAQTAATTAGTSAAGTTATTAATATAATPALQGLWSYLSGLGIGVTSPLLALGFIILSTTYVIMVIAGAFIVPVPTRNTEWKGSVEANKTQASAQFVEITKEADITQIENNTPTDVTYTITIKPKGNYSIQITDVADTFTGFGAGTTENLISPLSSTSFSTDAFNSTKEASYTVSIGEGLTDTLVTNSLIVSFEVYDINGFVVAPDQNYRTTESVRVGEPKEGCWPTSGKLYSLPFSGIPTHINSDAYDITGDFGVPVYAPFSGTLTRQIYQQNGYGIHETLKTVINGETLTFIFGHLNEAVLENEGDSKEVSAQEIIGYVGSTGDSAGAHLHYELVETRRKGLSSFELTDLLPKAPNGKYELYERVAPCN